VTRMSTANGVFWSVVDSGSGQALSFAIFLILARIITPEEYGTFALAGSFTCFGFYIMQGLAPAVLQRGSIGEEHTSTAFWTSLAIGAVFAARARSPVDVVGLPADGAGQYPDGAV
jgi:O-antigen/teichoic acid export membrane protein